MLSSSSNSIALLWSMPGKNIAGKGASPSFATGFKIVHGGRFEGLFESISGSGFKPNVFIKLSKKDGGVSKSKN